MKKVAPYPEGRNRFKKESNSNTKISGNGRLKSETIFKKGPKHIMEPALVSPESGHRKTEISKIPVVYVDTILEGFGPSEPDLYRDVLRVDPSASVRQIRIAYFRRGREILAEGGIRGLGDAASMKGVSKLVCTRFEAISMAYEIVSNPSWKAYYLENGLVCGNDSKCHVYGRSVGTNEPTIRGMVLPKQAVRWNENVEELVFDREPEGGIKPRKRKSRKTKVKIMFDTTQLDKQLKQLDEEAEQQFVSEFGDTLEESVDGLLMMASRDGSSKVVVEQRKQAQSTKKKSPQSHVPTNPASCNTATVTPFKEKSEVQNMFTTKVPQSLQESGCVIPQEEVDKASKDNEDVFDGLDGLLDGVSLYSMGSIGKPSTINFACNRSENPTSGSVSDLSESFAAASINSKKSDRSSQLGSLFTLNKRTSEIEPEDAYFASTPTRKILDTREIMEDRCDDQIHNSQLLRNVALASPASVQFSRNEAPVNPESEEKEVEANGFMDYFSAYVTAIVNECTDMGAKLAKVDWDESVLGAFKVHECDVGCMLEALEKSLQEEVP